MFPCACQLDDFSGGLLRWTVGCDHNDALEAAHPLALVRGVTPRPHRERLDRLVARQTRHLVYADGLARGRGESGGKSPTSFLLDPEVEHSPRSVGDARLEDLIRNVEAYDERGMAPCAVEQLVLVRNEGLPHVSELESANDSSTVIGVQPLGGRRIELLKASVGSVSSGGIPAQAVYKLNFPVGMPMPPTPWSPRPRMRSPSVTTMIAGGTG